MENQMDKTFLYICLYIILTIFFYIFSASTVYSKTLIHLGQLGKTWAVMEKDVTAEMQAAAEKNFDTAIKEIEQKLKKYQPEEGVYRLPACKKKGSFLVDMTQTITEDIKDGEGRTIYPAGYRFNPLDYVPFSLIIVVLDATDPYQIQWYKKSSYKDKSNVFVMLSDGYASDASLELKQPVYYLSKLMAERFNLRSVPSIVLRDGGSLRVYEINARQEGKNENK